MIDAQLQTLKTNLAANVNTVLIGGVPTAINVVEQTPDNADAVAQWYNTLTVAFTVWQTSVDVQKIVDAITWANYTPADAVPTDTALNVAIWSARSLACQGKQFNLQTMLQGRTTVNGALPTFVAGLKDCMQHVPAGAGGADKDAGFTTVQARLQRLCNNVEKLFATGPGTAGNGAATMTFEGTINYSDVQSAWNK